MDLYSTAFEYSARQSQYDPDSDAFDRLATKYIVIYLVVATFLLSAEQYIGKPMDCWLPEHFTNAYAGYIMDACWLNNTYVPLIDGVPSSEGVKTTITYYQWLGFILILNIGFYVAPNYVYRALVKNLNLSMEQLVSAAGAFSISATAEQRNKTVVKITGLIVSYLAENHMNRFTALLFAIKAMRLAANLLSMALISVLIAPSYVFFGLTALRDYFRDALITNDFLPLKVFCDFKFYKPNLASVPNLYTAQCILNSNIYAVFVFAILNWLQWLATCSACLNLITWARRVSPAGRKAFIARYLAADHDDKSLLNAFELLKKDGIAILVLLGTNTSDLLVSAIVRQAATVGQNAIFRPEPSDEAADSQKSGENDNNNQNGGPSVPQFEAALGDNHAGYS